MIIPTPVLPRVNFDHAIPSGRRAAGYQFAGGAGIDDAPRMEGTGILIGLLLAVPLWIAIGWAIEALAR